MQSEQTAYSLSAKEVGRCLWPHLLRALHFAIPLSKLPEKLELRHDSVCSCVLTYAPGETGRKDVRVWLAILLSNCCIILIDTVTGSVSTACHICFLKCGELALSDWHL
jgi:hypothetical protein